MKNYWILTRVMVKNMLSSMNPFAGTYADQKKRSRAILRTILLAAVILGAVASVVYIEYLLFKGLRTMRMPMMLPGLAIFVSIMFTLVMGLFQGLSELFQGKDAPFLAVLPLTSRQVFAARMTTLYLSELGVDALLCGPAFVLYAIGQGSAWPTALTGVLTLLFLPLIPLSVVALIASLLMRVSFFARHRESVVMFLSVVLAIAYSVFITLGQGSSAGPEEMAAMLMSQTGLMDRLFSIFPPIGWATRGLTGDFGMLALFLTVSAACVGLLIVLAGPGYLNQALSSTEQTVVRRRSKGSFGWKSGSVFRALHSLEWKEMMRTPAWAYNSLMGVVMFPLMICIGFIAGFSKAGDSIGAMRELLGGVEPGYVALVTCGVLMMGSMVNPAVSTAISREGGRWPFALTLPVRQKTRFLAKLAVGMEINLICTVMIAIVAWVLVRMNILWLLFALAAALLVGLAAAAFSLWIDALRPQLSWASEMEAIKKNFNQVLGMLLWIVLVGLCVVPAVLLWNRGGGIAMLAVAGVAAAEAVVGMTLLMRMTEKRAVLQ